MAFDESRNNILQTSVRAQLFQLQSMDMDDLSHKWRELFHTEPPDYGAVFMRRRLAHRIQELVYGGLSEEALIPRSHERATACVPAPGSSENTITESMK